MMMMMMVMLLTTMMMVVAVMTMMMMVVAAGAWPHGDVTPITGLLFYFPAASQRLAGGLCTFHFTQPCMKVLC